MTSPAAPAPQPQPQPALPLLLFLAVTIIGEMASWSCAGSRRAAGALHDAVIDCARQTAHARAAEYAERVEAAIVDGTRPNGEVSFVRARAEIADILESAGLEVAGCAAATAVARVLYPTADRPRGLTWAPEPSAAMVRDGWDAARAELLEGRRFRVTIGAL